jgi:purine nucleoside phosphorylase
VEPFRQRPKIDRRAVFDERRTDNDGGIMGGWTIGIIGGSGLYALDGVEDVARHDVETSWGKPSDTIIEGYLGNTRLLFLPRHGAGHRIPPSEINARANIDALKRPGATDILAISSVGSLREELPPGRFAVVDQFIDRTVARPSSFFGTGLVAHVSLADPTCPRLSAFSGRRDRGGRRRGRDRLHLSGDGRSAILDTRRKPTPSSMGRRRDRDDGDARSAPRPRGRAALRAGRHGDGL